MKRIPMVVLILVAALALSSCTTICETPFGLANPPTNEQGDKYWVSTCKPSALYKASPPAAPAKK